MTRNSNNVNVRVVFVGLEIEENIGSLARVMKNFELKNLFLAHPKVSMGDETKTLAMHGYDIIENAVILEGLNDAIKDVDFVVGTTAIVGGSERNVRRTAITPSDFAKKIQLIRGDIALLFGKESTGLTNEELDHCDFIIKIPTSQEHPTLNVTHAAAIVFYEIYKEGVRSEVKNKLEADRRDKERLVKYFAQLLNEGNYPKHKRKIALRSFRNVIGRALITRRETTILMGVYRRALLRLNKGGSNRK